MSRTAFSCQVTTIWRDGTIERDGVPLRDWKPPTITTAEWTRSITDARSRPNVAAQQIATKQEEIRRSLAQPKTSPLPSSSGNELMGVKAASGIVDRQCSHNKGRDLCHDAKAKHSEPRPMTMMDSSSEAPPRSRQAPLRPAAEPDLFGA